MSVTYRSTENNELHPETFREKIWRKTRENPAVPIGFAAVLFSFYMASRKMREQKSLEMNYWLRARVITQGFTILAISWSSGVWERLLPATAHERPGVLGPLPASAMGVLEGEQARKVEFDERMRKAEEAHKSETAVGSGSVPKKIVIPTKKGEKAKAKATEENRDHDLSGSYWKWLRWGSGSSQQEGASGSSSLTPSSSTPPRHPPPPLPAEKSKPSGSWLRWVTGTSSSGSDKGTDKDSKKT